jgi:phage gp29-like protein
MTESWFTTDRYDFAEVDRQALSGELATRAASWDYAGMMGMLPDPDPVLRKLADGGAKALEELTGDGHLISVIQSRKLGTLKKEFRFEPGSLKGEEPAAAAVTLCDDLVEDLERVDLYHLVSAILDAPLYGMSPIELSWAPGASRMRINDLVAKPSRWFEFDEHNQPRFRSRENPWGGVELPFGKFVFARHFPTYDNPYGLRLLSRCLWPVAFKKGGIKFWVQLAEKFGIPFLVGEYATGTPPGEQQKMLANLASMVQTAVAVIPQGGKVSILEGAQKASSEIHSSLKAAMDAEMSKVIMGQTLTAEVSDKGGSRAQGQVHEEILEDFRQGDQKLVKTVMEEIAWLYGQVNAPGVPTPAFKWFEEEEPQSEFATRDKTLQETGVRFRKSYYVRRYGLQEDDFDLTDPAKPVQPGQVQPASPAFAESEKDPLELMAEHLAGRADAVMTAWVEQLRALTGQAGSLEELRDQVLEAFPGMDSGPLAGILAEEALRAKMLGRLEVKAE